MTRSVGMGLCALLLVAALVGCASTPKLPSPVAEGTPTPTYAEVVAGYNKRVDPLENLSTATVSRIWYTDDVGKSREDQIEGRLIFVRPTDLFLRFDKLGETYAILGSNAEQYWWIELGDSRIAWYGRHEFVTPDRLASFGVPVHPRDLVELIALSPLPDEEISHGIAWSDDRRYLEVTIPGRSGWTRLTLDRRTYEPTRVDLLSPEGNVLLSSKLSGYLAVDIFGHRPPPRVAGEVNIELDAPAGARIRLRLADPITTSRGPRRDVFDFDGLITRYRVRELVSLDDDQSAEHAATR